MSKVTAPEGRASRWSKLLVASAFVAGVAVFFALGGPRYLDLATIKQHRDTLLALTGQHYGAALASAFCVYVLVVAFSVPGAAVLSLTVGFLFGRWIGTALTVTAATAGATLVFLGARYLFADLARRRLGHWYARLSAGFAAHGFSYLLFLRLVPLFPFFLVNLAPAIADLPLRTYVLATFLGIIPGSFVFVNVGQALGRIDSTRDLLSASTLLALALLGIMALVPVAYQRWRGAQSEEAR
jgi:uncharacterized membrane protein YdjX (TVP38/TMEM64 family)